MLARLMVGEGGAKPLLGSAYSVHCIVVARIAQDQERSIICHLQASVTLDEFCAAPDSVSPLPVSLHTLKRPFDYLLKYCFIDNHRPAPFCRATESNILQYTP